MKHRRSKESRVYWNDRLNRMLKQYPEMGLTENRVIALKGLLQKKYEHIMEAVSNETMKDFLRDTVYMNRKLRLETQGQQEEIKKLLSNQHLVEQDEFL